MNALQIIQHEGRQVIDSRQVAEMVGKTHAHLMRDIAGYSKIIEESNESNFGLVDFFIESAYQDSKGETRPCYLLTKKGCDMVANKMTGEKGVLFTAAYVTAFEQMREHIETGKLPVKSRKSEQEIAAETKRARAMLLNAKNRTADRLQKLYDRAGVKAEYQTLAIEELFAEDGVRLPHVALTGVKVTYDKGMIADRLGLLSKSGRPHAHAVGAIIAQLEITEDEKEAVPYHRHGHDGVDYQYTESVVRKVDEWLARREYPDTICTSGNTYSVKYRNLV